MGSYINSKLNHNWLKRNKPTLTDRFLLPLLELPYSQLIEAGFLFSFNGDTRRPDKMYKEVVLVFNRKKLNAITSDKVIKLLMNHSLSIGEIKEDNLIFLYYEIPFVLQKQVVRKFWRGEYSLIDANYINRHFKPSTTSNGTTSVSVNYQILTKSPQRKESLELALNCTIPDGAELLSKPDKYQEIYGYKYEPTPEDLKTDTLIEETEKFIETLNAQFLF